MSTWKSPILLALLAIVSCSSGYRQYRIDDRILVTLDDRTQKICVGLTLTDSDSVDLSLRKFEVSEIRNWDLQGAQIDLRLVSEIDDADVVRAMDVLRSAGVWKIAMSDGFCGAT